MYVSSLHVCGVLIAVKVSPLCVSVVAIAEGRGGREGVVSACQPYISHTLRKAEKLKRNIPSGNYRQVFVSTWNVLM